MAATMTLDEAYERLGLAPVLEFEQENQRRDDFGARRRIGTTTQVLVECMIDLIAYEASPAYPNWKFTSPRRPTRREDDFVILFGGRVDRAYAEEQDRVAGYIYKKLGGRHALDGHTGPPNLWCLCWKNRQKLRACGLPPERFFYDPCSTQPHPFGPARLVREIGRKPVFTNSDGDRVYEALDRSQRRVALFTIEQAQRIPSWTTAPVKIGESWHAPDPTMHL